MAKYFLLQFFDLSIPVVNLLGHLVHVSARLFLIHFQLLDLLTCLLELLIFLFNKLRNVLVMHVTLLNLIFFTQNHS